MLFQKSSQIPNFGPDHVALVVLATFLGTVYPGGEQMSRLIYVLMCYTDCSPLIYFGDVCLETWVGPDGGGGDDEDDDDGGDGV